MTQPSPIPSCDVVAAPAACIEVDVSVSPSVAPTTVPTTVQPSPSVSSDTPLPLTGGDGLIPFQVGAILLIAGLLIVVLGYALRHRREKLGNKSR